MQLRLTSVAMESMVEKLYSLFYQQAAAKNIYFECNISEEVPRYILADEIRLLQILSNLTSNSIKFTDKGGIKINIQLIAKRDNVNKIKVEISDTGIGISEQNKKVLFESFSQVDNSSTKSYGGTGLGLAISKELCKMMNGNIGVETKLGEGSTFWFTFEAKDSKRSQDSKLHSDATISISKSFTQFSPRILIVDDNSVNQLVAGEILRKSGCTIEVAGNGLEAIEKVKGNSYDLIFMDIQMPQMDGVTATREIRKLKIDNLPPIVAMTAYSMREDKEKFLLSGMDDYVSKPIKAEVLISKVKEWLSNTIIEEENEISPEEGDEIFDMNVVGKLRNFANNETLTKIYKEFESESIEQLEQCKNSLETDDINNILNNLHTLKGTAGTLGVSKIERLSRQIEGNLKQQNKEGLYQDFEGLFAAFEEFKTNYRKIFKTS
jgi:hypothetical protein